jgi:hypothetical protein
MAFCNSSVGDSGFAAAACFCAAFFSAEVCFQFALGAFADVCATDSAQDTVQPNHNTAATTMHRLLMGWIVSRSLKLGSGLDSDSAGDGMNLHSPAGISHSRAQAMLVLVFNHDGDSRVDISGHRLRRKMEIRCRRHAYFDCS